MSDSRPIGVFDSGVGGLTVLRAIHRQLPDESTIYLGDLARCPYGTRSQAEVLDFALQIGDVLAGMDIKLLVIACNTATAAAFEKIRNRYPFPVLGVINPGAKEALRVTRTRRIGVIATNGTVASGAYRAAILQQDPEAYVVERSASWLVPLIERGSLARAAVAARLEPVLTRMRNDDVDVLILGCTHFPLVRDIFDAEAGEDMVILDSATTMATEVEAVLGERNTAGLVNPVHRFLVTGPAEAFSERAQVMFHASPPIETICLTVEAVS